MKFTPAFTYELTGESSSIEEELHSAVTKAERSKICCSPQHTLQSEYP